MIGPDEEKREAKLRGISEKGSIRGKGRILALDPGLHRVGLALAGEGEPPTPLEVWANNRELWPKLRELVAEKDCRLILVGRPRSLDGRLHSQARWSEEFAERAKEELGLPVKLIDETLTTEQARLRTRDQVMLDAYAAQIILEDYLAENRPK
jgi:putative holliday junction resolvase